MLTSLSLALLVVLVDVAVAGVTAGWQWSSVRGHRPCSSPPAFVVTVTGQPVDEPSAWLPATFTVLLHAA